MSDGKSIVNWFTGIIATISSLITIISFLRDLSGYYHLLGVLCILAGLILWLIRKPWSKYVCLGIVALALLAVGVAKPYPELQTGDTANEMSGGNTINRNLSQTTTNNSGTSIITTTVNISIGGPAPDISAPSQPKANKESTPSAASSRNSGNTIKPSVTPQPEPQKVKELIIGDQVIAIVQTDDGLEVPFGTELYPQPEALSANIGLDSVKIVPRSDEIQHDFGSK